MEHEQNLKRQWPLSSTVPTVSFQEVSLIGSLGLWSLPKARCGESSQTATRSLPLLAPNVPR